MLGLPIWGEEFAPSLDAYQVLLHGTISQQSILFDKRDTNHDFFKDVLRREVGKDRKKLADIILEKLNIEN